MNAVAEHVTTTTSPVRPRVQTRLRVGAVDDPLERQADEVAERVLRMPDPGPALRRRSSDEPVIRRCPGGCGPVPCDHAHAPADDLEVRRAPASATVVRGRRVGPIDVFAHAASKVDAVAGGRPLPPETRAFFERRLGVDFSDVRVHTDGAAHAAATAVGALAYTKGSDIVFQQGRFSPGTRTGQRLLAHELAHVVQQDRARELAPGARDRGRRPAGELQRLVDEDGKEAGPAPERSAAPTLPPIDVEEAARIGRAALETMGYEEVIARALAAGILRSAGASDDAELQPTPSPDLVQRQGFAEVFTRYAVAAGIASQVDSPAPGPGDVVAIGILAVGLVAALAASTTTTTTEPCPPCPTPPSPEIDRVPPSRPHFPCPGDHWHFYVYNQNPVTCRCYGPRRMFGGCCGTGAPGAPC